MEPEALIAIIAAASAIVGSLVGGGATMLAAWFQRNSEREKSLREQAELAARKCESLCNQLAKDISEDHRERSQNATTQARSERIESTLPEIRAAALYLPDPLRERINEAVRIIYESYDVANFHPHGVWRIAEVARDEVHAMVAAFLQKKKRRQKGYLPKANELVPEYRRALQDCDAFYAEERELVGPTPNDVAYRKAYEQFYTRHPDLRPPAKEDNS